MNWRSVGVEGRYALNCTANTRGIISPHFRHFCTLLVIKSFVWKSAFLNILLSNTGFLLSGVITTYLNVMAYLEAYLILKCSDYITGSVNSFIRGWQDLRVFGVRLG